MRKPLLTATLVGLFTLTCHGYTFFEDDFEGAPDAGADADGPVLGNGMFVGANVFDASNSYTYQYFNQYPAPNVSGDGARFCNVATNQGGPEQGDKVLVVFSDYNNGAAHAAGDLVDALVFVEFVLEEADLGTTVSFQFDAKFGSFDVTPLTGVPEGSAPPFTPEGEAFLKVLNPATSYSAELSAVEDATVLPTTWGTYVLTVEIPDDPAWIGRILQAGFRTKTSQYRDSATYYDNLSLTSDRVAPDPRVIRIVDYGRDNGEFYITFESIDLQLYALQRRLPGGDWETVDDLEAFGTEETVFDSEPAQPTALYRVIELKE